MSSPFLWKSQEQHYNDAIKYLVGRQKGEITSLLTPWSSFNKATTNGIEWHSMIVIGGRPGTGKTTIKDQLIREIFRLNPDTKMRVLQFSLEMLGRVMAIRDMSAATGLSYKQLCSAEDDYVLSDEQLQVCKQHASEMLKLPIDTIEEGPTVEEFEKIIVEYMKAHAIKTTDKAGNPVVEYTKTLITLDHSLLLEVNKREEKSKNDMLYNLGTTLTRLKRKYPISFIILSQLNRNVDHPERNEDGKYGNYILESDIFGADALLQHADVVIGLNAPGKQKIRFYGPDKYIVPPDDSLLVFHFLKCRNGETGLAFFKKEFHKMTISESAAPPTYASQR